MEPGFITFLLLVVSSIVYVQTSPLPDVTYEELDSLDLTCHSLDNCRLNRTDDLSLYNCHCGPLCSELDTCCVDSEFRSTPKRTDSGVKCLTPYGERPVSAYMVDECGPTANDFMRGMCGGDAEALNDPFLLIPVTATTSGVSYRNYYCAACNEERHASAAVFWNLKLSGSFETGSNDTIPSGMSFDPHRRFWTVRVEGKEEPVGVSLSFDVPDVLKPTVVKCRPGVVAECEEGWADKDTEAKCRSYMALVVYERNGTTVRYRNPHCALCNSEDAEEFQCSDSSQTRAKPQVPLFVGVFSLDDKPTQCKGGTVFDPLAKKCRVLMCSGNQKVVNGKCVAR